MQEPGQCFSVLPWGLQRGRNQPEQGKMGARLPLRLRFVVSGYNTNQQVIRFSDEQESFILLFFVTNLSIFGIRGDRILLILGSQVRPGGSISC